MTLTTRTKRYIAINMCLIAALIGLCVGYNNAKKKLASMEKSDEKYEGVHAQKKTLWWFAFALVIILALVNWRTCLLIMMVLVTIGLGGGGGGGIPLGASMSVGGGSVGGERSQLNPQRKK